MGETLLLKLMAEVLEEGPSVKGEELAVAVVELASVDGAASADGAIVSIAAGAVVAYNYLLHQ